jgi:16S rRNA processing protein RimM
VPAVHACCSGVSRARTDCGARSSCTPSRRALAPDGSTIGTVVGVHNFGAGDLLELRLPEGRRTELVPFTEAFVPEVDIAGGRIVVVMPAIEGTDPDEEPVEETSGKTAPD